MNGADKLLNSSIKTNLCCHCGACAGLCPVGAITVNRNIVSVSSEKCVDCGLCVYCCPACGYRLSDLTLEDIKELPVFAACSVDPNVSSEASSGGFVTQTLLSLLDNNEITAAAVVTTGDNLNEASSKYTVTSSREDILSARRSKYTQATIDNVIDHIKNNDGSYAVVGLPCQLYAVTRAAERVPSLKSRIKYKIGMVCGYTYNEECIDGLIKVLGTSRENVKAVLGWREGGLPGNFSVMLKNGEALSMPFADEHSVDVTYYAQNRCLLCKDCLCEYGDVVCADIGGWADKKTLVIVRNKIGSELLNKVKAYGKLTAEKCNIPFEKTVLPFMLREKRAKTDLRLKKNKKRGIPTTNFVGGYVPKLLASQKIEALISSGLQEKARKNYKKHSSKQMLKIGHMSYHKLSSMFILKVLFKLQIYFSAATKNFFGLFHKFRIKFITAIGNVMPFRTVKPLRAVVIGLGQWGSQYLTFLKCSKYFKLVSAFDYDSAKLNKYAHSFGFEPADSIESLCKDFKADAVFILTPTTTHSDVFDRVSGYNLPVYMEKPIADSLTGAEKILSAAVGKDILLYVAHSMKYEPSIKRIKELLSSGDFGMITDIKMVRTVKSQRSDYYPNAALYQIGVHLIDVFYYLFGYVGEETAIQKASEANTDMVSFAYDAAKVLLKYGFGKTYNFSIAIACEKGSVSLSDGELKIITDNDQTVQKIPMKNENTIYLQLEEFYYAINEEKAFLNTKENAVKIMEFCEQIVKAGE